VTDFKVGKIDVDLGIGYGLTPGSDRWVAKTILSYAFPVPGKKDDDGSSSGMKTPLSMRPSQRQQSINGMIFNPLAGLQ
jgi:hypothetical protein